MKNINTSAPIYKAGLTKWAMPFDRQAGARFPQVPDDPGPIHAVRPLPSELTLREPYFIEDTYNYRAALCGAKVKIIMPNTFKAQEEEACADCVEEAGQQVAQPLPVRPNGTTIFLADRWSPNRWRRKRKQQQER